MDDFQQKRETLTRIRDEAGAWLDPSQVGQKVINFHEAQVAYLTAQITSTKFVNDHEGYLVALGGLQAHQTSRDAIATARVRYDRTIAELKALDEEEKAAA